jgi:tetratricopeptide (TPR) repeat protein
MLNRKWFPWLIVAAGSIAYANSGNGVFVFDDFRSIVNNEHLRQPLHYWHWILASGRPIVMATLAANYRISGLNVWSYHAFNLGVHIAAALVVYGLIRRTLLLPELRPYHDKSAAGLAFAAALLWLVHPLQTESVTYIIQRAEALMGLFYLLTVYCTLRGTEAFPAGHGWFALAVLACALGMGSKEVMVTAPIVVLLYDRIFLAESWAELFERRWPLYVGLAATWVILMVPIQIALGLIRDPSGGGGVGFHVTKVSPQDYALSEPGVIVHYLRLVFWPYPLCLDYDWPVAASAVEIAAPLLMVMGLLAATAWALWRRPRIGFLGAVFFLILAPTSSFMPFVDLAFEHRMYLALAPLVLLLVLGVQELLEDWSRRRQWSPWQQSAAAAGILAASTATLGAVTFARNMDYRSDVGFWTSTVAARPDNVRAHLNLGMALARQGRFREAAEQFGAVVREHPDDAEATQDLGWALLEGGQLEEAVRFLQKALEIDSDHAAAHVNLAKAVFLEAKASEAAGRADEASGKKQEAISHLRTAIQSNPDDALARFDLAQALMDVGDVDGAIEQYRGALKVRPDLVEAKRGLERALRLQNGRKVR